MRYINGFIMVAVLVMMCAQFTFAESDPVFGQPLIPDVQELIDEVWPEEERPAAGSILEDEWVTAYACEGLRNQWSPVWSPDGKYVYCTSLGSVSALWRTEVASGTPELVTVFRNFYDGFELHGFITEAVGFIHNGSEILVECFVIDEDAGTVVSPHYDDEGKYNGARVTNARSVIMAVDVETGEQRQYLKDVSKVVCSPDGNYLAYYSSEKGTGIRDTNTEEEWAVDLPIFHMSFMGGEEYIAYIDNVDGSMYRIPMTGGEPVLISDDHPLFVMTDVSPDGEWIAGTFDAGSRSGTHYDENGEQVGSWSSSGFNKIRFWNCVTDESVDPFPFEDNVKSSFAMFSPDGTKVCYRRKDKDLISAYQEIYILDIDLPLSDYDEYPLAVADESPASFALLGNYPNPFNPTTTIGFNLSEPGSVNLTVYSVTGQAIRELVSEEMAPGRHSVVWDGRDDMGNQVGAGVYISRLAAGGQSVSGRMTLVK